MARPMSAGAAVCVAVLGLVIGGCASRSTVEEVPPVEVAVRVGLVEERRFATRVQAQGQWRSATVLTVVAPFAATVEQLGPQPGDLVRSGARVAVLVSRESRAALRGAQIMQRRANDPGAKLEAQRAIALAQQEVLRVPLLAPGSGVVLRRMVESGADVVEGAELLQLVSDRDIVFELHVPAAETRGITPGRPARIQMEGGESVAAVVRRRLPFTSVGDQTALFWLSANTGSARNLLDRFGTASIEIGTPRQVVAVPDSAIVADDLTGEMRVACVTAAGIAVWNTVRLGQAFEGWHELLSPALAPGTRVITSGGRGLPDSTRVRWAP